MSALRMSMRAANDAPLLLEKVSVRGSVHATLARVTMRQEYRNDGDRNVEAIYTFPLPPSAVLLRTVVELGGRRYEGAVLARRAAEARYEEAIAEGDTAIMVERPEPGLYTMNLGNLMAGESATVEIEFAQLLDWSHGRVRLALPMVLAPRYGEERSALQPQQRPDIDMLTERAFDLQLRVSAKGKVYSPTHAITTGADGGDLVVSLTRNCAWMDRDFVLVVDAQGRPQPFALVAGEGEARVGYVSVQVPEAPLDTAGRDVRIVVDCSGSMAGESIALARKGAINLLNRLRAVDRFGLVAFGSTARPFLGSVARASEAQVEDAIAWVQGLDADMGGTELAGALEKAMALAGGERAADIFLVTDGQVALSDAAARGAGHRVFVVGIGLSPQRGFLEEIVQATGGAIDYIAPGEDVAEAIGRQFARVTQLPVSELSVSWGGDSRWRAGAVRNAYSGDTIHAFAGVAVAARSARVGYRVRGEAVAIEVPVAALPAELDDGVLERLAAETRIREGLREKTMEPEAATALAVAHQLVTSLTSYVLVIDRGDVKAVAPPRTERVRTMLSAATLGASIGSMDLLSIDALEEAAIPPPPAGAARDLQRPASNIRAFAAEAEVRYSFLSTEQLPLSLAAMPHLPDAFRQLLQRLIDAGHAESAVLRAFWVALAMFVGVDNLDRGLMRKVTGLARDADTQLVKAIEAGMKGSMVTT